MHYTCGISFKLKRFFFIFWIIYHSAYVKTSAINNLAICRHSCRFIARNLKRTNRLSDSIHHLKKHTCYAD